MVPLREKDRFWGSPAKSTRAVTLCICQPLPTAVYIYNERDCIFIINPYQLIWQIIFHSHALWMRLRHAWNLARNARNTMNTAHGRVLVSHAVSLYTFYIKRPKRDVSNSSHLSTCDPWDCGHLYMFRDEITGRKTLSTPWRQYMAWTAVTKVCGILWPPWSR